MAPTTVHPFPTRWSDDKTFKFIELYNKYELLWNRQLPFYASRVKRQEAYIELAKEMGLSNFDDNDVKNKIKNLRSTYYQEVRKLEKRRNLGHDGPSSLSWFYKFKQIMDHPGCQPLLKEDMKNYIYYTTMGGRAVLKSDVVPHKFTCQPTRRQSSTVPRPAAKKRQRQQILEEVFAESSKNLEMHCPQVSNTGTISVVDNIEVDSSPLNTSDIKKAEMDNSGIEDSPCDTVSEVLVKHEYYDDLKDDYHTVYLAAETEDVSTSDIDMKTEQTVAPMVVEAPFRSERALDEFQMFANNIAEQLRQMPLDKALQIQVDIQTIISKERIKIYQAQS